MEVRLCVGNLAAITTAADLRALFAEAGTVIAADVLTDRDSGQSRGYGFVTMSTQAEADSAAQLFNAYVLSERALTVFPARAREARPAFGRRGGARASGRRR